MSIQLKHVRVKLDSKIVLAIRKFEDLDMFLNKRRPFSNIDSKHRFHKQKPN